MKKLRRWRSLADFRLQGSLCLRVTLYWMICLASVALMIGWRAALRGENVGDFWSQHGAIVTLPMLVLPFVLLETIIWSNRVCGPLLRLRRALDELAAGETIEPLRFRKHDALSDLARDVNRIAERLNTAEVEETATPDRDYRTRDGKPRYEEVSL